jgi:hypothetical protein
VRCAVVFALSVQWCMHSRKKCLWIPLSKRHYVMPDRLHMNWCIKIVASLELCEDSSPVVGQSPSKADLPQCLSRQTSLHSTENGLHVALALLLTAITCCSLRQLRGQYTRVCVRIGPLRLGRNLFSRDTQSVKLTTHLQLATHSMEPSLCWEADSSSVT